MLLATKTPRKFLKDSHLRIVAKEGVLCMLDSHLKLATTNNSREV